MRRQLLVKDVKVFLRDVSQWLQLLPLFALVLLYLYNFSALDLERIPYMSGVIKNVYALVNLGMAGFVVATVAVRFVFPGGLGRGRRILAGPHVARSRCTIFCGRNSGPALCRWFCLRRVLTIAANELMGVDPFLKVVAAVAVIFMTFAMVGLAVGLGARYPRFGADPTRSPAPTAAWRS